MKLESLNERAASNLSSRHVSGRCLCGAVELEIDFPAFWAWHDHSAASRRAHGAAYATYIGCWRKHARVAKGRRSIARFEDATTESTRSFCSRCGTPLLYERKRSPHMVNIPRALFTGRTGREPRYHVAIEELQDWAYTGNRQKAVVGETAIEPRKATHHINRKQARARLDPYDLRCAGCAPTTKSDRDDRGEDDDPEAVRSSAHNMRGQYFCYSCDHLAFAVSPRLWYR
jgi:hypothetical protein